MIIHKKNILHNETGFALIAAIIACLILLAIGMLVINMSTGDLFTTAAVVGNKKALAGAESGITKIISDVDPKKWTTTFDYTVDANCRSNGFTAYTWIQIPGGTDAHTEFAVCRPEISPLAPIPAPGEELGGGGSEGGRYIYRYNSTVVGRNTSYETEAKLDVGVGFGPI